MDKRELHLYWSSENRCIEAGPGWRGDQNFAFDALDKNPAAPRSVLRPNDPPDPPFLRELERRGYDVTTFELRIQRPADHAWVTRDAFLYPQKGGLPVRVDWIRRRGAEIRVFLQIPKRATADAPLTQLPFSYSSEHGLALAEVERDYQPHPVVQPDWSPDELPPMCPQPRKP